MIGLWLSAALLAPPQAVTITTPAGERRVPVHQEGTGPVLPAGPVLTALSGTAASDGVWAEVRLGPATFRFLLGAPVFAAGDRLHPLAAPAFARGDTLFLPLQFLAEVLPRQQGQRFLPSFLDTLAANYGTGMRLVDYRKPEKARAGATGVAAASERECKQEAGDECE